MRLPKRGERGFTLIELLIVVAILGVLAAVVIPNVTRFVGAGEQEAAETELHNVQLAVTSMMLENGITTITTPINEAGDIAVNDMTAFPDVTTEWTGHSLEDVLGYRLYEHDMTADGLGPASIPTAGPTVNYVTVETTTYFYTCEADGTVKQWADAGTPLKEIVWD